MSLLSLAALAASAAVVFLVAFLIPAIIELRKTVIVLRDTILRTEAKLDPALDEMRQLLFDLRKLADATASRTEEVKSLMTALGDTGESVHRVNSLLSGAVDMVRKPASYWAGIKAAGKFILEKRKEKRRMR